MPISDVANISITISGAGPTREGFGEPLIAAYHTHYTDRVREYSTLAGMVSDGFAVTDPAYLAAAEVFSQNPSPPALKIGRRALSTTQVVKLTCISTSNLDTYVFQLRTPGGTWVPFSVASTGVPATDAATINTAVIAASIANLTASNSGGILTLTMAAPHLLDVESDLVHMTLHETTTDPGVATDLAAILAADSAWYGLILDNQSPAEITSAAAWAESNGKLFIWNTSESGCMNSGSTTDIMYTEKQLNHTRSAGLMTATQLLCYGAAAWMGRLFPTDAGSENWAFKTLSGVPVDVLTDSQIHAVENKNGSVYTALKGLALTQFGKRPDGEWIDITRGQDALLDDMETRLIALFANNLKIAYTDAGIDIIRHAIQASLQSFVNVGFLAATPGFVVTLPTADSVSSASKAARNLPGGSFTATLAGAINSVTLTGVVNL